MSKYTNYRLTLKPGLPSEPMTGRAAVAAIYVKFQDGEARIPEYGINGIPKEDIYEMMKRHPAFNRDFHLIEDEAIDPYAGIRKEKEPKHTIFELDRGAIANAINPRKSPGSQTNELVAEMAKKMAMEIAPQLAKEMLKRMMEEKKSEKEVKEVVDNSEKSNKK